MKNEEGITARSAMPTFMKESILVEEGMRRVRNYSLSHPPEVIDDELKAFNKQLKNDGHTENFRLKITEKVISKYEKVVKDDVDGVKPFFRDEKMRNEDRIRKGRDDKTSWFKKKGYVSRRTTMQNFHQQRKLCQVQYIIQMMLTNAYKYSLL